MQNAERRTQNAERRSGNGDTLLSVKEEMNVRTRKRGGIAVYAVV